MRSPAGAFPNGNSSSTRNRSEASVPDAAEAPQRCPACSSTLVAPTAKAQTANSYNRIMFLFAAESFNQFMLRLRYIRQYSEVRKTQAAQISSTKQRLSQQLGELLSVRNLSRGGADLFPRPVRSLRGRRAP